MKAADLYPYWRQARRDLVSALSQLNDEQLDYSPRQGMRTIGDVARHIIDAEAGWVNLVVLQKDEPWPQYPQERLPTVQSILHEMERVHAVTIGLLQERDVRWLDETREQGGHDFALRWVFWHILDHEIHHRGEIFLMLGMLGVEVPDI
jgi:uncharacterized damage-inducible protein DinB